MELKILETDALRLEVLPEAGASIVAFGIRGSERFVPLMRATPLEAIAAANSSQMASFVLAPFSNRLRDAAFRFAGRTFQLEPNCTGGFAIHGCVRKRPWEVLAIDQESMRLRFESARFDGLDFPFPFRVDLTYALRDDTLEVDLRLRNQGAESMPAGFGLHPYYERSLLDPSENVELCMRTGGTYEGLCPRRAARPLRRSEDFSVRRSLPREGFDTCFAAWDGRADLFWPKSRVRAEIECSAPLGHVILFTPPGERFFALEPVSNANNGFNLLADGIPGSGVTVLESEEEMSATFRLRVHGAE